MDFCEDVYTWMEGHEMNVIVVHCKGGKGTFIASVRAMSGSLQRREGYVHSQCQGDEWFTAKEGRVRS